MKHLSALVMAMSAIAGAASAQTVAPPAAPEPYVAPSRDARYGTDVRTWLDLQRSGRTAGSAPPLPGEIADLNWRRYAESYKQPIPETFRSTVREAGSNR
jgi:hypothetical protein